MDIEASSNDSSTKPIQSVSKSKKIRPRPGETFEEVTKISLQKLMRTYWKYENYKCSDKTNLKSTCLKDDENRRVKRNSKEREINR